MLKECSKAMGERFGSRRSFRGAPKAYHYVRLELDSRLKMIILRTNQVRWRQEIKEILQFLAWEMNITAETAGESGVKIRFLYVLSF